MKDLCVEQAFRIESSKRVLFDSLEGWWSCFNCFIWRWSWCDRDEV